MNCICWDYVKKSFLQIGNRQDFILYGVNLGHSEDIKLEPTGSIVDAETATNMVHFDVITTVVQRKSLFGL